MFSDVFFFFRSADMWATIESSVLQTKSCRLCLPLWMASEYDCQLCQIWPFLRVSAANVVVKMCWKWHARHWKLKCFPPLRCSNRNRKGILASTDQTWFEVIEEKLFQYEKIDLWVEAHVGSATCKSSRWSAVLNDTGAPPSLCHTRCLVSVTKLYLKSKWLKAMRIMCFYSTVKYNAPESISLSWSKTNLTLRWRAVENFPAEAQVRYRRMTTVGGTEPWTDVSWVLSALNFGNIFNMNSNFFKILFTFCCSGRQISPTKPQCVSHQLIYIIFCCSAVGLLNPLGFVSLQT